MLTIIVYFTTVYRLLLFPGVSFRFSLVLSLSLTTILMLIFSLLCAVPITCNHRWLWSWYWRGLIASLWSGCRIRCGRIRIVKLIIIVVLLLLLPAVVIILVTIIIIKETVVVVMSWMVERWLKIITITGIGIGIGSLHCSATRLVFFLLLGSSCINVSVDSKRVLLVFVFINVVSSIVKGCHVVIN